MKIHFITASWGLGNALSKTGNHLPPLLWTKIEATFSLFPVAFLFLLLALLASLFSTGMALLANIVQACTQTWLLVNKVPPANDGFVTIYRFCSLFSNCTKAKKVVTCDFSALTESDTGNYLLIYFPYLTRIRWNLLLSKYNLVKKGPWGRAILILAYIFGQKFAIGKIRRDMIRFLFQRGPVRPLSLRGSVESLKGFA